MQDPAYHAKYREQNREKINHNAKVRYHNNREALIHAQSLYYEKNKEKIKEYLKQYRERNKEKIKQQQLLRKDEIKEKKKIRERIKHQSDPYARILRSLRRRFWSFVKGDVKQASVTMIVGCTLPELQLHLQSLFTDGMPWDNYGEWHIDHIRPCSSFDLTDFEQQKICFHYTNLQPLWAIDNLIKGAKYESSNSDLSSL